MCGMMANRAAGLVLHKLDRAVYSVRTKARVERRADRNSYLRRSHVAVDVRLLSTIDATSTSSEAVGQTCHSGSVGAALSLLCALLAVSLSELD